MLAFQLPASPVKLQPWSLSTSHKLWVRNIWHSWQPYAWAWTWPSTNLNKVFNLLSVDLNALVSTHFSLFTLTFIVHKRWNRQAFGFILLIILNNNNNNNNIIRSSKNLSLLTVILFHAAGVVTSEYAYCWRFAIREQLGLHLKTSASKSYQIIPHPLPLVLKLCSL